MAAVTPPFSAADWERLRRDYAAWWQGILERPLVQIVMSRAGAAPAPPLPHFIADWSRRHSPQQTAAAVETVLTAAEYLGDAYPTWWPNFGAGVVAAFLGSPLLEDRNTVWFYPLAAARLADIQAAPHPDSPWWRQVLATTRAACARLGAWAQVGFTDLGGAMDILASLRGTQALLCDLLDCPDQVARLVDQIHDTWFYYYDRLAQVILQHCPGSTSWAPTWGPGRAYMFQSDFSYMISPACFAHLVLPELERAFARVEYPCYHLDGIGQLPHLDLLLASPTLRGIQWVPGDGKPPQHEWLPVLGRIIGADKRCQVFCSLESALRIVRALGGKGFMFRIGCSAQELEAAAPALAELGVPGF